MEERHDKEGKLQKILLLTLLKRKLKPFKSVIITDPHEILLFSPCIKSTIVVSKMTKQLSEENGGGPFCQQGNYQE